MHSSQQSIVRHARACPSPNNCPSAWGSGPPSNICFLEPTQVHNPNGISIGSAVYAQLTAESPYTLQRAPFSPKFPLSIGDLDPHLTHDSLGPYEPITQTASNGISIGSAVFPQMITECPYTLQWDAPFPLKIVPSHGAIWTPSPSSNTWFPGPTRILRPNGISISSAVFAGLTSVTDRPTDRPRYSVGNNRPHLRT